MKRYLKISILTTLLSYLITSFITWDLLCFLRIPELEVSDRSLIVMLYLLLHFINVLISLSDFLKSNKQ